MIRSVVRQYNWPFFIIDRLYLDDIDHRGLEFWYDDVIKMNAELKKK